MIWIDHIEHIEQFITFTNLFIHKFANFFYLCPIKRNTMHNRTASWNAPYTFSSKEKDVETGYGYVKKLRFFSSLAFGNEKQVFHYAHCLRRFGARYNDSGLSIWLSVDPMSDKYPSLSPYNYCANNPVMLTDPDGRWIPGLDENGVKEGDVIKGDAVKKATGSDVLKGNWGNMTDTQKASQIMFGMMYGEKHNSTTSNGAYAIDINDFVDGFYVPENGLRLNNVTVPVRGGTIKLDHMTITSSSATGGQMFHVFSGGDLFTRTDGSSFHRYTTYSSKNLKARSYIPAVIIAVPSGSDNVFRKTY